MKRLSLLIMILCMLVCAPALAGWGEVYSEPTPTPAPTAIPTPTPIPTPRPEGMPDEILFRNIAWGTSWAECDPLFDGWYFPFSGEYMKTYAISEIVYGERGDFAHNDINLSVVNSSADMDVAGYVAGEVNLYFAFVPDENGVLTREDKDTALYGAAYTIESKHSADAYADLLNKLTSLYGAPIEHQTESDWNIIGPDADVAYDIWEGGNDSRLVLKWTCYEEYDGEYDYEDTLEIIYIWDQGDILLQQASDIAIQQELAEDKAHIGQSNTDGL